MKSDASEWIVNGEDLRIDMEGEPLFRNLELKVQKGERVLLSGDSGTGKSSLLSALLGFVRFQEGRLEVLGQEVADESVWKVRERTAYLPQEYELKLETVRELFFFPYSFRKNRTSRPSEEKAAELFERLGLRPSLLDKDPDAISGGEKQRVIAASLLGLDKELYLLDEPSSSLDPTASARMIDAFFEDPERTLIVVAHDECWKERVDRVIALPDGEVLSYG